MSNPLFTEYLSAGENMRHFGNMRFAQLTLYFAFTAAALTLIYKVTPALDNQICQILKIVSAVVSVTFAIMDHRAVSYWASFKQRAVEIESTLGFKQYTDGLPSNILSATNATRLIVWGGAVLWSLAAFYNV